jgi:hypothetical protein
MGASAGNATGRSGILYLRFALVTAVAIQFHESGGTRYVETSLLDYTTDITRLYLRLPRRGQRCF